jgi:endonuclease YncB( thermonuclease family)
MPIKFVLQGTDYKSIGAYRKFSGTCGWSPGQASVMDGDTLEMHGQRIRLHGIDAPEPPQSCHLPNGKPWRCGHTAARRLRDFIGHKTVTCERKDRDRYGRMVAVCVAGGEDLGAWLVEHSWALAYARYSTAYVAQQKRAECAQIGIWRSRFQKPWKWRRTYAEDGLETACLSWDRNDCGGYPKPLRREDTKRPA